MRLRGSRRDAERVAELVVGQPLGDQLDHLPLPVGDQRWISECLHAGDANAAPVAVNIRRRVYFAGYAGGATRFRSTPTPASSSSTTSPGCEPRPAGRPTLHDEQLARPQHRVPRRVLGELLPRVRELAEVEPRALLAVHARRSRRPRRELVRRDEHRPDREREVLALRRPEARRALGALEVARRPVVRERDAADRAVRADHRGDAEADVELRRARPGTAPRPRGRRPGRCSGTRRTAARGARAPRRRARSAGAGPAGGTRPRRAGTRRARARRRRR